MSATPAKLERAEQILGELAELGLMLARDLALQAKAGEDVDEKVALAAAFQKMSRTVRLSLALDFKLQRDAAREARDAVQAADAQLRERQAAQVARPNPPSPSPAEIQKRHVRNLLNRLIWNEVEGDGEEYDILREDLDARLDLAGQAPGFADLPIDLLAHRLKTDMRLGGELVVTTPERLVPANAPATPQADTG